MKEKIEDYIEEHGKLKKFLIGAAVLIALGVIANFIHQVFSGSWFNIIMIILTNTSILSQWDMSQSGNAVPPRLYKGSAQEWNNQEVWRSNTFLILHNFISYDSVQNLCDYKLLQKMQ